MTWRFALLLDPAPAEVEREDYRDSFRAVDASAPALRVGELSTQRGDGVFETIGVVDGHPQEVAAHLERLAHSAALCDLPAPNLAQWRQAIASAAAHCPRAGSGEPVVESSIKLILSRGEDGGPAPTAWVTATSVGDFSAIRSDGTRAVTLDRGLDSRAAERAPWLLLGAKTLSYAPNMAALREARRRGVEDALYVSSDGIVLEAPTASVILRRGDGFVTPAPASGILHGTTQLSVFSYLEERGFDTAYAEIPVAELAQVENLWLVSSIRLAAPVRELDGRPLAVDRELTGAINAYLLSPRD